MEPNFPLYVGDLALFQRSSIITDLAQALSGVTDMSFRIDSGVHHAISPSPQYTDQLEASVEQSS